MCWWRLYSFLLYVSPSYASYTSTPSKRCAKFFTRRWLKNVEHMQRFSSIIHIEAMCRETNLLYVLFLILTIPWRYGFTLWHHIHYYKWSWFTVRKHHSPVSANWSVVRKIFHFKPSVTVSTAHSLSFATRQVRKPPILPLGLQLCTQRGSWLVERFCCGFPHRELTLIEYSPGEFLRIAVGPLVRVFCWVFSYRR